MDNRNSTKIKRFDLDGWNKRCLSVYRPKTSVSQCKHTSTECMFLWCHVHVLEWIHTQ